MIALLVYVLGYFITGVVLLRRDKIANDLHMLACIFIAQARAQAKLRGKGESS